METKNIVLFGQTGVGKSSVVNLMADAQVAETSPGTERCTLHWKKFTITFDEFTYTVFDTVGLEEHQLGKKEYLEAIENAYNLISTLDKGGGVHLLLFCVRAGRFTSTIRNNYRLFHEWLCEKRVPIVLVLTGLEGEENMEDWWTKYGSTFGKYGVTVGHACITAVNGPDERHQRLYERSRCLVRDLVIQHAHGRQYVYSREGSGYRQEGGTDGDKERDGWFAKFIRMLIELLTGNHPPKKRDIVYVLTKRCGVPRDVALQLAKQIRE